MNPISETQLTLREALCATVKLTVAAAGVAPVILKAAPEDSAEAAVAFVPENDYPFFGYEPD